MATIDLHPFYDSAYGVDRLTIYRDGERLGWVTECRDLAYRWQATICGRAMAWKTLDAMKAEIGSEEFPRRAISS